MRKQKEDNDAATLAAQHQKNAAEALRKPKEDNDAATLAAQQQKDAAETLRKQKEDNDTATGNGHITQWVENDTTTTGKPWVDSQEDLDGMAKWERENDARLLQASQRQLAWEKPKKAKARSIPPPPPYPEGAASRDMSAHDPEDLKSMIQGLVQAELARSSSTKPETQQYHQLKPPLKPPSTKKRKRAGWKRTVKVEKQEQVSGSDSDSSVEILPNVGPNTARRILWQRGHNAMLPSIKHAIIEDATVDSVAEAHAPLCTYGFAIIRDMTEVFAPKNRCTREQRDFITRCMSTIMLTSPSCSSLIYDFMLACCFLLCRWF